MRIFFSIQHLGSFLVHEPTVRELASRGHDVHLAVSRAESLGWERTFKQVLHDHPTITWSWLSPSAETAAFWFELSKTIRIWADYLRYLDPHYAEAPTLRSRAEERVPPRLVRLSQRPAYQHAEGRARLLAWLRTVERAMPTVDEIRIQLRAYRPDVVLLTPLVYLGSWQFEVLRAARAEGLRTVFAVGSWDHLSSKALIRDLPDRVLVWNGTQKDEAVQLHGVPADRVVVTGAQCYDRWFNRLPARSREDFCRRVGLPADRPYILYAGSALFRGSPSEAEFVARWVRGLRASGHPVLREAGILVRPHPARMDEWRAIDLAPYAPVAVYGSNPMDDESREDYFESLHYSAAVAGLNTSAFLEAAIVGRPVHTVLTPEFADNQGGTLHFHYLLRVGGGVLQAGRSFDEHYAQLAASLTRPDAHRATTTQFVREFIRPQGVAVPATDVLCDAIEEVSRLPQPARERVPARLVALRWAVYPLFVVLRRIYGTELFRDDWRRHDAGHQRELEARTRAREARRAVTEQAKRDREQRRETKATARTGAIQAEAEARAKQVQEKARRLQDRAREKAARTRTHQRATRRARLKQSAKAWLHRFGFGRQGQAT